MLDPHELYELTDDLPDLGQPVLIQTLTGFVDAGSATRLARSSCSPPWTPARSRGSTSTSSSITARAAR